MSDLNDYESTAIIGMAGRFPGAENIDEYWDKLVKGEELISFFSKEDALKANASKEYVNNKNYIGAGGILNNISEFDAEFFGCSEIEAKVMDPQHRIFLECAWEALEQSGYSNEANNKLIGVFAASSNSGYFTSNILHNRQIIEDLGMTMVELGNNADFLPSKVSYKLNLKGPSVAIQCGCASSLAAVHFAVQSILNYQCDMAIVGGVSIRLYVNKGYVYTSGGILSSDGHCRPFDENNQGTVGGNGVGVLVLKRYSEAIEDSDNIIAIIKGTSMNNDGFNKVGFTAPGFQGQVDAIKAAYEFAQLNPEDTLFVETQGVGTSLGDTIEFNALTNLFQQYTEKENFCALGSVKANIGHLDVAAGIASLIKTALVVKNKIIPPIINFTAPSSNLNIKGSPFYFNRSIIDLSSNEIVRAGVNCFGVGGTNVHIVLESFNGVMDKSAALSEELDEKYIFTFSSKNHEGLTALIKSYIKFFHSNKNINIKDVAYTIQTKRQNFEYRKSVIASNIEELVDKLNTLNKENVSLSKSKNKNEIAFVFSEDCISNVDEEAQELCNKSKVFEANYSKYTNIKNNLIKHLNLQLNTLKDIEDKIKSFIFKYCIAVELLELNIKPKFVYSVRKNNFIDLYLEGKLTFEKIISKYINDLIEKEIPSKYLEEKENMKAIKESNQCVGIIFGKTIRVETLNDNNLPVTQCKTYYGTIIEICAYIWELGYEVKIDKLYKYDRKNIVPLPTYQFKRNKYWIDECKDDNSIKRDINYEHDVSNSMDNKSREEIFDKLIEIIKSLVGNIEININNRFSEIKGSSLLIIQLILKINEAFDIDITVHKLLRDPTIGEIYETILKEMKVGITKTSNKENNVCIVNILKSGVDNLILIPPLSGIFSEYGIEKYSRIGELINENSGLIIIQPTANLKSIAIEKENSINYIAKECVEVILNNFNQDEYVFGGWCDGGILALEICKILDKKGKNIKQIFLFDTYEPSYLATLKESNKYNFDIIDEVLKIQDFITNLFPLEEELKEKSLFNELISMDKEIRIDHIMSKIKSPQDITVKMVKKMYRGYDIMSNLSSEENIKMFKDYKSNSFIFNLIIFNAIENKNIDCIEKSLGWESINLGTTHSFYINGNHTTMLMEPNVNELVQIMNSYFN